MEDCQASSGEGVDPSSCTSMAQSACILTASGHIRTNPLLGGSFFAIDESSCRRGQVFKLAGV
jgi:hypothetical protein